MLLDHVAVTPAEFHELTGFEIKPEGACQGDVCVPLPGIEPAADGTLDLAALATRMGMPLVADPGHGIWALGPRAGGHVLDDAVLPEIELPDFDGAPFRVSSLRGRKVMLLAWASW
jgi:hypothetical protein